MSPIDMAGRVPAPKGTISIRLIATVVVVFLVLVAAVIYGFHFRLAKEQARKDAQHVQLTATDAAQSNRQTVEAAAGDTEAQLERLQKQERAVDGRSNSWLISPVADAARTITQPFPPQQQQPATGAGQWTPNAPPPIVYAVSPPAENRIDVDKERRTQALARRYSRLEAALEAPTGVQEQRSTGNASTAATSADPLQAQLLQFDEQLRQRLAATERPAAPGAATSTVNLIPESDYRSQNEQIEKNHFNNGAANPADDYLKATRTLPLSRWVVQRGTVIPAALPQRVVSDLPGDLIAEVQRDVYDSPTQKYVMIPAGSRLVGEYNSSVAYGQNRVQIVWTSIYFPDGSFIDLDRFPSHAADGASGLKDQVDNHWKRVIAGVALSSVLAAGLQISQNRTNGSVLTYPSTGQEASAAIGTQASQLGQQITGKNLNIQPTLKIRPGEMFAVSVKRDMLFSAPYQPFEAR